MTIRGNVIKGADSSLKCNGVMARVYLRRNVMPPTHFCYHCSKHHPADEMRQVDNKGKKRWRCIKSIEAAKQAKDVREEFGRNVTANNKGDARDKAKGLLNPEVAYRGEGR